MSFWEYLILFGCVIVGGSLAYRTKNFTGKSIRLLLSFSGSYFLGITVLHLMPGVFMEADSSVGLWMLAGFFIQLTLEQLSLGIEHGHIHAHHHGSWRFAMQIMIGLCIHAYMEGLPLGQYAEFHALQHGHEHGHHHLLIGIILHKMPAAFALMSMLLLSGYSQKWVWLCLIIFASMSPLGALSAELIHANVHWMRNLMALVIGSFLHLSTTILFESDDSHQHRIAWKKMMVIALGIGLSILSSYV
ncbi:MAG TPA: ZIP family metal transporter [Saprospiraceae bacterium]|nr:ZIP family metal transporter [Saprospiraceae bacterium]HMQ84787.1 ZIP family metal transporter [Saprospiraceae bacterium]